MPTLPTLVFVHGSWHSPETWSKVIPLLEEHGYSCHAVALPTVGEEAAIKTLQDDTDVIHDLVESLVNGGKEVVVVTHSYGGVVGANALRALSKKEREMQGKAGGVRTLCMLCSFIRLEGFCPATYLTSDKTKLDIWTVQGDTFTMSRPREAFYNDLDEDEAKYWVSRLRPSRWADPAAMSYAAWRNLPVHYLICERDYAIPTASQDSMIEMARGEGASVDVLRCNASHSPMLSMPELTSSFIRRAAGEGNEIIAF